MIDILKEFFIAIIEEFLSGFNSFLMGMVSNMLYIETMVSDILNTRVIEEVYTFIYFFGASLVVLKLLKKGFMIYILWRDGDADASPQDMVIGLGQAAVIMVAFPSLYKIMAEVTVWFTDGVMTRLAFGESLEFLSISELIGMSFVNLIVVFIYLIVATIMWMQFVGRGVELLILRLGIPIACLGLIDSDGGMFKPYMQTLFKTLFTSALQIILMSFSMRCMASLSFFNMIFAIAVLMAAFKTPNLLQNFLIATSGGNITNKIYSSARLVQMAKGFLK